MNQLNKYLKKYKPITPSLRHACLINKSQYNISNNNNIKFLKKKIWSSTGGRNNQGKICTYHRGGGSKKLYRYIDFKYSFPNIPGEVVQINYDPNRSSFISCIKYLNGVVSYSLLAEGSKVGDKIVLASSIRYELGSSNELKYLPVGSVLFNLEQKPGEGSIYSRAAGTYCTLLYKGVNYCLIRLPSKKEKKISLFSKGTVGTVSNSYHREESLGKAGRNRNKGKRPHVRGVAMNPVDHPNGGGEGRTSGRANSVDAWGNLHKGTRTKAFKYSINYIHSLNKISF